MNTTSIFLVTLLSLSLFSACKERLPKGVFSIDFAESVEFDKNNSTISFSKLLEDSRCPTNFRCIWAGLVKIELEIEDDNGVQKIELTLRVGQPELAQKEIGDRTLTLLKVTPHPVGDEELDEDKYAIELKIE